jgi:hypothetical protein
VSRRDRIAKDLSKAQELLWASDTFAMLVAAMALADGGRR